MKGATCSGGPDDRDASGVAGAEIGPGPGLTVTWPCATRGRAGTRPLPGPSTRAPGCPVTGTVTTNPWTGTTTRTRQVHNPWTGRTTAGTTYNPWTGRRNWRVT